jgi:hypothetical protein
MERTPRGGDTFGLGPALRAVQRQHRTDGRHALSEILTVHHRSSMHLKQINSLHEWPKDCEALVDP